MGLASRSKGVEKYRLSGSARAVHCIAAIAAAANLLLVLFLLNGRIAADTILVVQGKLAPFEWVGKSTCHLRLLLHLYHTRASIPTCKLRCKTCDPCLFLGMHQFAPLKHAVGFASHPGAPRWCPYADHTAKLGAVPT